MVWARFGGILHSSGVLADMSCSANPVSVCLRAGAYLCADGCIAKAQTKICDAVIKEEGYMASRFLGHSDLKMLTWIYDHTSPETLRKAIQSAKEGAS